jgi:hypothetical protein
MESWIYIFSQFTPEALVLELGLIFILSGAYAVYWIIRKRKYGVVGKDIPAGPVKAYLNELIGHADQLKSQLFGILSQNEGTSLGGSSTGLGDNSDLGKVLSSLETKLDAQGKAIANLTVNGVPVVMSSSGQANAGQTSAPAASVPQASTSPTPAAGASSEPVDEGEMNALKEKLSGLETRLEEYSIIEDDLANLKRIQQENAELRAQLKAQNGGGAPAAAPAPVAAAPKPTPEPEIEAAPAAVPDPVSSPEPAMTAAKPEPALGAESAQPKVAAPAPDLGPPVNSEMGEDDLVKEFEKMLQG